MSGYLKTGFRSVGAVAAIAADTFLCSKLFIVNPTTVGFLYLVTILLIATHWGLADAVLASVMATLCYNYFFLPPAGTLTIADPSNWVALVSFLVTSLIASQLAQKARQRAAEAMNRQSEMERLYALSRAILLADATKSMGTQIAREIARIYESPAVILYSRNSGETCRGGPEEITDLNQKLRDAAVQGTLFRDDKTQTVVTAINFGGKPIGSMALTGMPLSDMALQSLSNLVSLGLEKARNQEAASRAEAARQSGEFKSTLLDALAHDFNTPLTTIKAAASAMLSTKDLQREEEREMLTVLDQEATRLATLVNEALHLARIDAGKMQLNKERASIGTVLEKVLKHMESALEGRDVTLSIATDLPLVFIDVDLMQLVLRHLLDNAVKYSPLGSPISISAQRSGDSIVMSVWNRGEGIPEWERSRIFEKYYRGASVQQRVPGTGMGLPITRGILLAHGGDIWVESISGEGVQFFVSLPIAKVEIPA